MTGAIEEGIDHSSHTPLRNTRRRVTEVRSELHARLVAHRPDIEKALTTRIAGIASPAERSDPSYLDGLRGALLVALDYGLDAVRLGETRAPAVPTALTAQARLAARSRVRLDVVLRRYVAGFSLLTEFIIEQAEEGDLLRHVSLHSLLRGQSALFDRLIAAVSEDYLREANGRPASTGQQRAERLRRLLDGELIDTTDIGYEFEGCHVGLIGKGAEVEDVVRDLAGPLDSRLLIVRAQGGDVWAWLASRHGFKTSEIDRLAGEALPSQCFLAIGEPGKGLDGWRLTHRQAQAAVPIAVRTPGRGARYADVALLASILQNDVFGASLRQMYLEPLEAERDGGEILLGTLRAYFSAARNVSSAAAALGVNRHTVTNRLRMIEEKLNRPLDICANELHAALRLMDLGRRAPDVSA